MLRSVVLAASVVLTHGHASLMNPIPRNSNDRDLAAFVTGSSPLTPCTCANGVGGGRQAEKNGCDLGPIKNNSGRGQACLW